MPPPRLPCRWAAVSATWRCKSTTPTWRGRRGRWGALGLEERGLGRITLVLADMQLSLPPTKAFSRACRWTSRAFT